MLAACSEASCAECLEPLQRAGSRPQAPPSRPYARPVKLQSVRRAEISIEYVRKEAKRDYQTGKHDERKPSKPLMIRNYSLGYAISFVGRTQELADISTRLLNPECRLLTLTGLGGSGKTRLAIQAAATVARQFPNGAFFVPLQPLSRSDLLVPTIAQAVGLTFSGEADPQQQLLDYLRDKALLLLLDNFEHLLDGVAPVTTLLAFAPGVKVLVTSREALRL